MFNDEKELRRTIRKDYHSTGPPGKRSFRKAVDKPYYYSEEIGESLPFGTAATIYNGGACNGPIPVKWLKAYNIYHYDLAPVCPHCQEVHPRKTCPNQEPKRRKRTNVNMIDAQSAFSTIIENQHTTREFIAGLADNLTAYLIMTERKGIA